MKLETKASIISLIFLVLVMTLTGQPVSGPTVLKSNQVPTVTASVSKINQQVVTLVFATGSSSFTLPSTPLANTKVILIRNGVVMSPDVDFTNTGNIINLNFPSYWASDDRVIAYYFI